MHRTRLCRQSSGIATGAQAMHGIEQLLQQIELNETFSQTPLVGWLILLGGLFLGVAGGEVAQSVLRELGRRMSARGWNLRGTAVKSVSGPAYLLVFAIGLTVGLAAIHL